ncbi:transporter [Geobacter sp. SVR]|nr:transporter [Geobacter sp. SVR]GCF86706.1 transporter [Geobacter sp. SVR]
MDGMMLVLLAAVIWGTTGTSQALAPSGASSMTIGALRLIVGGTALLTVSLLGGGLDRNLLRHPWVTIVAASMVAAYQLCFFAAVSVTGVAVGTMVAIGSSPVLAGVATYLLRRRLPDRSWFFATIFAIAGCILLFIPNQGEMVHVQPRGVILAMGAGAAYVGYTMAIKTLLRSARPDGVIAVVFALGGLLLSPALIGSDLRWAFQPRGILVVLHLGLFATALAYVLFARGLKTIPTAHAVTLSLAEPLTASLLGFIVLRERLTSYSLIGMISIFAGLAILGIANRQAEAEPATPASPSHEGT